MSEVQQHDDEVVEPAEWPTREQMERVQEFASDGESVRIERAEDDDVMKVKVGTGSSERYFDTGGVDITAKYRVIKIANGLSFPIEVVRRLLGDKVVDAKIADALSRDRSNPDYHVGMDLNVKIVDAVNSLLDARSSVYAGPLEPGE